MHGTAAATAVAAAAPCPTSVDAVAWATAGSAASSVAAEQRRFLHISTTAFLRVSKDAKLGEQ
jgi:hypothetical protein